LGKLGSFVKTGHVSPVFEQALRAQILEGVFVDEENQLHDILEVLEMKVESCWRVDLNGSFSAANHVY
jgi:hypothetical protein